MIAHGTPQRNPCGCRTEFESRLVRRSGYEPEETLAEQRCVEYARSSPHVGLAARHGSVARGPGKIEKSPCFAGRIDDQIDHRPAVRIWKHNRVSDNGTSTNALAEVTAGALAGRVRHFPRGLRQAKRRAIPAREATPVALGHRHLRAHATPRCDHLAADGVCEDQDSEQDT